MNPYQKLFRNRTHKYGAVRTHHGGYSFASRLEAQLFEQLKLMEKGGILRDIKCQPHVYLTDARIEMIPDFLAYETAGGNLRYWEAKGFLTPVWQIKKRLWKHYGPAPLEVWKGNSKGLYLDETIIPK